MKKVNFMSTIFPKAGAGAGAGAGVGAGTGAGAAPLDHFIFDSSTIKYVSTNENFCIPVKCT
jgi:hypothetical protein